MNEDLGSQPIPAHAQRAYSGALFQVYRWSQVGYDGKLHQFEKVTRPDSVAIVPVVDRRVVLAWERQPGTAPALGFLGGHVEPGEEPDVAARRELGEEAGWSAGTWEQWESVRASTKVDWSIHLFIARDIRTLSAPLQSEENIELREHTLDELANAVTAPDFGNHLAALPILRTLALPGGRAALASRLFGLTPS